MARLAQVARRAAYPPAAPAQGEAAAHGLAPASLRELQPAASVPAASVPEALVQPAARWAAAGSSRRKSDREPRWRPGSSCSPARQEAASELWALLERPRSARTL